MGSATYFGENKKPDMTKRKIETSYLRLIMQSLNYDWKSCIIRDCCRLAPKKYNRYRARGSISNYLFTCLIIQLPVIYHNLFLNS
jgi:hypothetical protein